MCASVDCLRVCKEMLSCDCVACVSVLLSYEYERGRSVCSSVAYMFAQVQLCVCDYLCERDYVRMHEACI